ncbi:hypothetical protein AOLI_G00081800 [Acnodon oligacanthus]
MVETGSRVALHVIPSSKKSSRHRALGRRGERDADLSIPSYEEIGHLEDYTVMSSPSPTPLFSCSQK